MNLLSQKDLEIIETFCGEEYSKRLQAIQKRQEDNSVKIVNTGMVSSGKSSLYNMLINSNEEEYFPTGAARTTTKASYFDSNNISYIDTPGIDVRNEDDALAFSTIIESDIILMIHNIRTGPLNKSEVEWLEEITKRMSSIEVCRSRLIFVISWKDTREKEEDYDSLVDNVKRQVFEIVGGEIPVFEVSAKKYQQGIEKNKDVLIKNSGIIELKQYLENYANEYSMEKKNIDNQEYTFLMENVKELLKKECDSKQMQTQNIYNRNKDASKTKHGAWKRVYDYFVMQRNKLSDLERELNNI